MAKGSGVWGIDVGQCALKALRCRLEGGEVVADGFDYIEYPKLLSQPEANPAELVRESLELFLSRNNLKGDKVCISVGGQLGLAKYFKPPPVDAKKLPDIVKYEARQQIPFNLNDVIWDYQRMGGGAEVDGIMLESEIGLFAMKREQVFKSIAPFDAAGIPLDVIQLAPLSIYSAVVYDQLQEKLPPPEDFDPENPPPSTLVISLGTDATDLLVTNGYRLWQRNIPLGGSTFTKQLTKELKLTFAKAEHLKRNAHTAEDPRAIFQAMRPVFNDIVSEIQRSINFFHSLDRKAKITKMVILGNAAKLPGLKQYLQKHLAYEMIDFAKFDRLKGDDVVGASAFTDNMMSFATTYGLCLQGLGQGTMKTNLIPREILTDRMIRAKRPWAVAALGALLLGMAGNYVFHYAKFANVAPELWATQTSAVEGVVSESTRHKSKDDSQKKTLTDLEAFGKGIVGERDRKLFTMELWTVLNQAMPFTPGTNPALTLDPAKVPFRTQHELHIDYIESAFVEDVQKEFLGKPTIQAQMKADKSAIAKFAKERQDLYGEFPGHDFTKDLDDGTTTGSTTGTTTTTTTATPPANNAAAPPANAAPSGPGYIIEISGYHYFHPGTDEDKDKDVNLIKYQDRNHVLRTLIANLMYGSCVLPIEGEPNPVVLKYSEIGITNPVLVGASESARVEVVNFVTEKKDEDSEKEDGTKDEKNADPRRSDPKKDAPTYRPFRTNFKVQFLWQETPIAKRQAALKARLEAEQKAQAAAGQPGTNPAPGTAPVSNPSAPANPMPPANNATPPVNNAAAPANNAAPPVAPMPDPAANAPMPPTDPPAPEPEKAADEPSADPPPETK